MIVFLFILYVVLCYLITFISICVICSINIPVDVERTNVDGYKYQTKIYGNHAMSDMKPVFVLAPISLPIYCITMIICHGWEMLWNVPDKIGNFVRENGNDILEQIVKEK